jgi:D-beta-D-heptose 7-phosphate kinase / D-beta-D-heptose 1-phosphate adenosyltransferase
MFSFLKKINQHHSKRCLVVGDIVIDSYIYGKINRMSSEAPIPVVDVSYNKEEIGGAGNVVKNLKALGFDVKVISIVGNDDGGEKILESLSNLGVDARVRVSGTKITSKKNRLMVDKHQVARFDYESQTNEDSGFMETLKNDYLAMIDVVDIVVISDYDRGVLEYNFTRFIIEEAIKRNKPIICDPRVKDFTKYSGVTTITPNLKEANNSIFAIKNDKDVESALLKLHFECKVAEPVITLSERGIAYLDKNNKLTIEKAFGANIVDVTGAGDTVVAAFCLAKVCQLNQNESCILANMAASIVVEVVGTSVVSVDDIKNRFSCNQYKNTNTNQFINKIKTKQELFEIVQNDRNKSWVFTNGCFDIIHTGHLDVISRAKNCGDLLIVGLNSDASVKRLKGQTRPVNNEFTRASVLAALEFVDFVVIFEEDTPEEIIKFLRPNVLAKGIDYIANPQDLPGAKYVDKIEILGTKLDSTTEIINRILDKNV